MLSESKNKMGEFNTCIKMLIGMGASQFIDKNYYNKETV